MSTNYSLGSYSFANSLYKLMDDHLDMSNVCQIMDSSGRIKVKQFLNKIDWKKNEVNFLIDISQDLTFCEDVQSNIDNIFEVLQALTMLKKHVNNVTDNRNINYVIAPILAQKGIPLSHVLKMEKRLKQFGFMLYEIESFMMHIVDSYPLLLEKSNILVYTNNDYKEIINNMRQNNILIHACYEKAYGLLIQNQARIEILVCSKQGYKSWNC